MRKPPIIHSMMASKFAGALAALCVVARASNQEPHSLRFEPNVGQTSPAVTLLSRGPGRAVMLSVTEAAIKTRAVASRMDREAPNLAVGKAATQSSTAFGGVASLAVDGNTNGILGMAR